MESNIESGISPSEEPNSSNAKEFKTEKPNPEIHKKKEPEIENKVRTESPLPLSRNESPVPATERNPQTLTKRNFTSPPPPVTKKQPTFNDFRLSTTRKTSSKIQQKLSMFASTEEKVCFTQRCFNVHLTLYGRCGRQMNVETTLFASWVYKFLSLCSL